MTVNELKLELECYQLWINPECDVENLSLEEWAEFITIQEVLPELYDAIAKPAPILRLFR